MCTGQTQSAAQAAVSRQAYQAPTARKRLGGDNPLALPLGGDGANATNPEREVSLTSARGVQYKLGLAQGGSPSLNAFAAQQLRRQAA